MHKSRIVTGTLSAQPQVTFSVFETPRRRTKNQQRRSRINEAKPVDIPGSEAEFEDIWTPNYDPAEDNATSVQVVTRRTKGKVNISTYL
jgi:hypothetical protein